MLTKELNIHIFKKTIEKLNEKHNVSQEEITECFQNTKTGHLCIDDREQHNTNPPTLWFIGLTNAGRKLKVIFICINDTAYIKTAYDAKENVIKIFKNAKKKKG